MLTTIFSDLHSHQYGDFNTDGKRLENCLRVLRIIFKFNHKNGIKYTLFGGDLYDQQGAIPTGVVNSIIAEFKNLFVEYPDQTILAITGNHDQASKNLWTKPAISALTHLETVFTGRFILLDNASTYIDGVTIRGIPYYEYAEDFLKALEACCSGKDSDKDAILLMHQTPSGLGNESIPIDVDVNHPLFKNFRYVFNGHIHKRQDINDKFTVIGSPLHRDLGDEGDDKGFLVVDVHTPSEYQFISTKGKFPEFVRVKPGTEYEQAEGQYRVLMPEVDSAQRTKEAKVEEFNTSLKAEDLITNYWLEAGAGDKALLATGLSLLR